MHSLSPTSRVERARPLLGTRVAIRVTGLPVPAANRAIDAGFAEVARIHTLMSFHEPASDVSRLNREALHAPVAVNPSTFEVLRLALDLARDSTGVFDVTVAAKLVRWQFLPQPDSSIAACADASWRDIELMSGNRVRFHRPLWVDLGGIAKGYAVDRALASMNLDNSVGCCINAGGDLRVRGPHSEQIALRGKALQGGDIPIIELENASLASSSSSEHVRKRGKACVGPHVHGITRRPVGRTSFVSIVNQHCAVADALTKVVLACGVGASRLLRRYEATALLYTERAGWRRVGEGA